MGRTQHTNDVVPRIKAEVAKMNNDGSLPPGVKLVPYYDRTRSCQVTTHTVSAQPDLRLPAGLPHPVDLSGEPAQRASSSASTFPSRLFFAIIMLVLQGQDANLLSIGAVDFGIIVDSAVILVENIFRNFQADAGTAAQLVERSGRGPLWAPIRRCTIAAVRAGPTACG